MSLIASFCSIKSPIFPPCVVFILISPCFLSVICTPNGKTAEPEYYGRAAKAKERMRGKSLSDCRLELVRSPGRANFHIWKLASPNDQIMQILIQKKFSGFPLRQTVVTNVSRFLARKSKSDFSRLQFLCTAVGFTSSSVRNSNLIFHFSNGAEYNEGKLRT